MARRPDPAPPSPSRRALALEAVALAAFTLWVAWPFLQPDSLVIGFDTITYGGPNAELTFDALRAGDLPTWNDAIFGGIPHLANPNASALYPLKWLFVPFGPERALGLLAALHLAVLAAGCLALARQLRWRPPAGLVAGVVLVGCGSTMVKVLQTEQLAVLAWAPWLLWAIERVLRAERPARPVAVAGLVGGVMLVAGHPQMLFVLAPVAVAWTVGRVADTGTLRRVPRLAAAGLLAVALAGAQLLPTAALLPDTVSSEERPLSLAADPAYTAKPTLVAGNVLGDVTERNQPAIGGSGEANLSVGAAAMALVALALVLAARDRHRGTTPFAWTALAAAVVAVGAWVLALGPRTVVYRVAADVVPGFSQARVPGRWLVAASVALTVLAGYAAHRVAGRRLAGRDAAALAGVVVVVGLLLWLAAAADWLLLPPAPAPAAWAVFAALVVVAVAARALTLTRPVPAALTAGVLVALAAAPVLELGLAGRYSPARALAVDDAVAGVEGELSRMIADSGDRAIALTYDRFDDNTYLLESLRPNANVVFGVRSIDGYDGGPQLMLRWIDTMRALAPDFNRDLTLRSQGVAAWPTELMARFGVRWALVDTTPGTPPPTAYLPGWSGPVAEEDVLQLWENPAWRGEAELRFATAPAPPEDAGLVLRQLADAAEPVAVVDPDGPALACDVDCAPVPATVDRLRPGRLRVTVDAPRDGLLVVAEQYDDGWRARVDGRSVSVEPADGMFLGIPVGPGAHTVELRYEAPGLRTGLVVTLLAALVTAGLLIAGPRLAWPRRSGRGPLGDGDDRLAERGAAPVLDAP